MTTFNSVSQHRPCLDLRWALFTLTCVAVQFSGANAWAAPMVVLTGHHTDRFATNSIPGAPVGDKVQVVAVLDSSDPIGSPTISVQAVQGDTTITLDYIGTQHTLFEDVHLYFTFIDFDPNLVGSWEITPTDSTGTGSSSFTPAIADPAFLPLVEDITALGTPFGSGVSWTLPNFGGFDPDGLLVRVIDYESGGFVFESEVVPVQTTSYEMPAGTLQIGVEYVYAIVVGDFQGSNLENISWTFSEPFRYTTPGDFDFDGDVDGRDFLVWQRNPSVGELEAWRTNYGTGSIVVANVAIPEPNTLLLFGIALVAFLPMCRAAQSRQGTQPRSGGGSTDRPRLTFARVSSLAATLGAHAIYGNLKFFLE